MSKQHLRQYVEQKNRVLGLFGQPLMDADGLTRQQVEHLLDIIEGDLSPESLTCDGELRGAKLRSKQAMLLGARAELERIANGVAA